MTANRESEIGKSWDYADDHGGYCKVPGVRGSFSQGEISLMQAKAISKGKHLAPLRRRGGSHRLNSNRTGRLRFNQIDGSSAMDYLKGEIMRRG